MAASEPKVRWARALRYAFGGALCVLAGLNALIGSAWYISLGVAVVGAIIMLGGRRIFRPGVTRTADEILCRFVLWYEGDTYLLLMLIPLMGVAMIGAGYAPAYPAWLRFGGIFLLGLTPLMLFAGLRMWRRSVLRITPSELNVRLATLRDRGTAIQREAIESIESKMAPNAVSGRSLQVQITYHPADSNAETILLGPQLSVQPSDLLDALVAWKDAPYADPHELLDAIERILRGHSTAGV